MSDFDYMLPENRPALVVTGPLDGDMLYVRNDVLEVSRVSGRHWYYDRTFPAELEQGPTTQRLRRVQMGLPRVKFPRNRVDLFVPHEWKDEQVVPRLLEYFLHRRFGIRYEEES